MKIEEIRELKKGIFICEDKFRFLCTVKIGNRVELCHIASSSKLKHFIDLKNKEVLLIPNCTKNSRTKYTVLAVKIQNQFVLLNLPFINKIAAENLSKILPINQISLSNIYREKRFNSYKSDLYVEAQKLVIEIKTVIANSNEEQAEFPNLISKRAEKQLKELIKLMEDGFYVNYIIFSLTPHVTSIKLNDKHNSFCGTFQSALNKGLKVYAYNLDIKAPIDFLDPVISEIKFIKD